MTGRTVWREASWSGVVVGLDAAPDGSSVVQVGLGSDGLVRVVLPADHEPPGLHEVLELVV